MRLPVTGTEILRWKPPTARTTPCGSSSTPSVQPRRRAWQRCGTLHSAAFSKSHSVYSCMVHRVLVSFRVLFRCSLTVREFCARVLVAREMLLARCTSRRREYRHQKFYFFLDFGFYFAQQFCCFFLLMRKNGGDGDICFATRFRPLRGLLGLVIYFHNASGFTIGIPQSGFPNNELHKLTTTVLRSAT